MGKAMRVVAGALGAGALLLSAAGTASAGGDEEVFDQHIHCAPSFSLLFPATEGCRTNILIDNQKAIFSLRQTAGGDISGTVVGGRRGLIR